MILTLGDVLTQITKITIFSKGSLKTLFRYDLNIFNTFILRYRLQCIMNFTVKANENEVLPAVAVYQGGL